MLSPKSRQVTNMSAHLKQLWIKIYAAMAFLSFGLWPWEAQSADLSDLFAKISYHIFKIFIICSFWSFHLYYIFFIILF